MWPGHDTHYLYRSEGQGLTKPRQQLKLPLHEKKKKAAPMEMEVLKGETQHKPAVSYESI